MPLRYVVDGLRAAFYTGTEEYDLIVQTSVSTNLIINGVLFAFALVIGTIMFVRREQNR